MTEPSTPIRVSTWPLVITAAVILMTFFSRKAP